MSRPGRRTAARSAKPVAAAIVLGWAVALLLGPLAARADATWAIVATDPETGEVGAAMASCVPAGVLGNSDQVLVPVILVPADGAAVATGTFNVDSPALVRELFAVGASPEQVLDGLLDPDFDAQPSLRAYGLVGADGRVASFTGAEVEGPIGQLRDDGVVAQGSLLVDTGVVDAGMERFLAVRDEGGELVDALAAGLLAGSMAGGDRRCGPDQTALFGHVAVARPGDDPIRPSMLLTVTVDEEDGQNPVALLQDELAAGATGWVDRGLLEPATVSRLWPLLAAGTMALAAVALLRKGMGAPSARRGPRRE